MRKMFHFEARVLFQIRINLFFKSSGDTSNSPKLLSPSESRIKFIWSDGPAERAKPEIKALLEKKIHFILPTPFLVWLLLPITRVKPVCQWGMKTERDECYLGIHLYFYSQMTLWQKFRPIIIVNQCNDYNEKWRAIVLILLIVIVIILINIIILIISKNY